MVRLIMGDKGTGKTKRLIEMVNEASVQEPGNVVCIEANSSMTYDIHHHIRLVSAEEYTLSSFEALRGFVCGLYAGNYDISYIFIDNLCKIVPTTDMNETARFLNWLDKFSEKCGVKFTVTVSGNQSTASDEMKKFL